MNEMQHKPPRPSFNAGSEGSLSARDEEESLLGTGARRGEYFGRFPSLDGVSDGDGLDQWKSLPVYETIHR